MGNWNKFRTFRHLHIPNMLALNYTIYIVLHDYRLWFEISVCEYLRDFSDKMEGTREGMRLALPPPKCHLNGSFEATQCAERNGEKQCWCVDSFGSEIPNTR